MASESSPKNSSGSDVEFLEDEDEEPTEEQVIEYAEFLGMDLKTEEHLLWIAREGVAAPVPHPWKTCTEKGDVFYFNFETSESSWEHPCDAHYRNLLEEHRKGVKDSRAPDAGKSSGEAASKQKSVDAKEEDSRAPDAGKSSGEAASEQKSVDAKEEDVESFVSEMVEESEVENGAKDGSRASSPWSSERSDAEATEGKGPTAGQSSNEKDGSAQSGGVGGIGLSSGKIPSVTLNDKELSEVSEDFRSDWGAPSPLGSSAQGLLNPAPHSLEVSASEASVLGPGTPQAATVVKSWALLKEDVNQLVQVLTAMEKIRGDQTTYLKRLQGKAQ